MALHPSSPDPLPEPIHELLRYESDEAPAASTPGPMSAPARPRAMRLMPQDRSVGPAETHRPSPRARTQNAALLVADAVAVALAVSVVVALTRLEPNAAGIAALAGMAFAFARLVGLNDKDALVLRRSTLDEVPRLAELAALSACAYWLTLPDGPGRAALMWLMFGLFVALVVSRMVARALLNVALPTERCLFIGDMAVAGILRNKIEHGNVNARIVGALPLRNGQSSRMLSNVDELKRVVRRERISRVVLAPSASSSVDTLELIRVAKEAGVQVSIFPRLFEVVGTAVEFEDLEGLTLMGVRRFGLSPTSRALKRAFDLIGASVATLAATPMLVVVALAVRLDSRGPVLFRQERVGRDGERFSILKFRSMTVDAEQRKDALRDHNETRGLFKISDDPRVTRVGRLLRATSLDELPQLFNVFRGDMSLVGPRPLVADEDSQVIGLDRRRLHLTPGMTGPWQVMRSGRVPMHEMVAIDYLYVSTWSLWNDLKLLLRTVGYVFARGGI